MIKFSLFSVLVLSLVVVCSAKLDIQAERKQIDQKLVKKFLETQGLSNSSKECNDYYYPKLTKAIKELQKEVQKCEKAANESRNGFSTYLSEARRYMVSAAGQVLNKYRSCDEETNDVDFFSCIQNVSSNDIASVASKTEAINHAQLRIQFDIKIIDKEEKNCEKSAYLAYKRFGKKLSEDWIKCDYPKSYSIVDSFSIHSTPSTKKRATPTQITKTTKSTKLPLEDTTDEASLSLEGDTETPIPYMTTEVAI